MISNDVARKKLAMLGVVQYRPDQKQQYILKIMQIYYLMISSFISISFYLIFDAITIEEYIQMIFFLSVQITAALVVSNCIWNTNGIYEVFNNAENIIENSKNSKPVNQFGCCHRGISIRNL